MQNEPVIEVERLGVAYGAFHAVRDLSFSVGRGELYALLGTNGAGKTSTLEVVEGHRAPSSGTVRVFGESPRNRAEVRPRVGIMLQESGFSPDLTVGETVALIGGLTGRADRVDRVVGLVGLDRKSDTKVSQLSGGEQRRLDFATAIYGSPELIFLDEPTTGLDVESRDALWRTVDRMREDGATVVLTTHYLEEAQQRADRIGLMHEGSLRVEGTVADLTAALPATIRFRPPRAVPAPSPLPTSETEDGRLLVETHALQRDLHTLLGWADRHGLELRELEAGPTSLDGVFRSVARS
ncbi:ABC transporter ATP-binding protein [Gulosibacter sp. 10]|uniref:ABC transporter ATP-binding protein n=1 Tax=Gulosibacter sp. 10 TaxID=1255570 RepID=UPI00097E8991|nr:ABC transporter ATP-binding protein [Gulosibacter sp. 10]SJM62603.1 ABC transport protein, ATP-binding subunit [Gulosibacter sp. 10]